MTANLYVPIAPPGTGKSYLAKLLVDSGILNEDAVVSSDNYRRILSGDPNNQDVNGPVFKIVEMIVENRLSRGLDVYVDATNLGPALKKWFKLARYIDNGEGGVRVIAVEFDTDEATIRAQNAARERVVPDDVMDRMIGSWRSRGFGVDSVWCDARRSAWGLKLDAEQALEAAVHPVADRSPVRRGEATMADIHWGENR